MKRILQLLPFIFLCLSSLKSQSYLPLFASDSTEWSVHTIRFVFGDGWENDNINGSSLNNDTIIFPDGTKVIITTNNDSAWLVHSTIGRKLLVFDLTLQQSDSFLFYTYESNILDSSFIHVDSVYILNGRKVISFDNDLSYHPLYNDPSLHFNLRFIEGVGPNFFYTYPILTTPYIVNVICKKDNETYVYESEDIFIYSDCKLATGISSIPEEQFSVRIRHNTIEIENIEKLPLSKIIIVDALGKNVFEESNIMTPHKTLTLQKSGLYFLVLETEHAYYVQKLQLRK